MTKKFEQLMAATGMTARPQQTKLVEFAREAIENKTVKLVQAGTGTGKSYVALAMALEASEETKKPSVVVAPTNALVNQYVLKDAPAVQKVLGGVFAYLKGRPQYLCSQSAEGRKLKKAEALEIFNKAVAAGHWEWAQAGLEGWGCTGDCNPKFDEPCAMQFAREAASKADVIVTNGHVLVWDLKVDQMTGGVSRLLPDYGALFIDECHEIDSVTKGCNSDQIGPNSSVHDMMPGLMKWVIKQGEKMTKFESELAVELDEELTAMVKDAMIEAGRLESQIAGMAGNPEAYEDIKILRKDLKAYERFIGFATNDDDRFISTITKELDKNGEEVLILNRKCIDASSWTRPILTNQPSVLISGTIPPSLASRLGVRDATLDDVGTPFHYGESVLAISSVSAAHKDRKANPTKEAMRITEVCRAAVGMSKLSHAEGGGGTLILFTSWRDFNEVMPLVEQEVRKAGLNVPVFEQSRDNQQETAARLEEFKAHGHAIMGGVLSMWTGVDVPGNALRQVIIFQLPWPVRTQEVLAVEKKFGFQVYADDMMTRLVQGIGRLLRKADDNGRIYIADSRAKNLKWGRNPMSKHVAQFSPYKKS